VAAGGHGSGRMDTGVVSPHPGGVAFDAPPGAPVWAVMLKILKSDRVRYNICVPL
jgi:hypothetical protein